MSKKCMIVKRSGFPDFEVIGYLSDCVAMKDGYLIKGVFDTKDKGKVFPNKKDAEFVLRNICNKNCTNVELI